MATDKTPSSKHGRLHEEEAARDKSVMFGTPDPAKAEQERQKNLVMRNAMDRVAAPQKSGSLAADAGKYTIPEGIQFAQFKPDKAKTAPKPKPDITQRMDALRSALSDKYPHNDVEVTPEGLKVAVPTGHITIESEKVAACANNAELRAYIDALPIS